MKWTITIEQTADGFTYSTDGPHLGHAGFEPTRAALAKIIAGTIEEYLPSDGTCDSSAI
jgi:hypothetical protein